MTPVEIEAKFNSLAKDEGFQLKLHEMYVTMLLLDNHPNEVDMAISIVVGAIQLQYLEEIWNRPVDQILSGLSNPNQVVRVLTKYRISNEESIV